MRIMVWNIQTFAKKKLLNTTGKTLGERILNQGLSEKRRSCIIQSVVAVDPNILVVLEVRSGSGKRGSLASAGGATASVWLLNLLRQQNANWCLVPPLKLVDAKLDQKPHTEAIAMYFRSDTLTFIGPLAWPANAPPDGVKVPVNPGEPRGPYAAPFDNALPANNFFAGLPIFPTNNGLLWFPEEANRTPFICRFQEIGGQARTLTVAASHPSPGVLPKSSSARLAGWVPRPQPNEVQIFPGDFNVNQLSPTGAGFYDEMNMLYGVTSNFGPGAGATTLKEIKEAAVASYLTNLSLDNILTRYGQNVAPPNPNNAYIVNLVAGVPGRYPSLMEIGLTGYNVFGPLADDFFRMSTNYGKIAHFTGVSDHIGLTLDV